MEDFAPAERLDVKRVRDLVLGPLDRQVILLWLEGLTTAEIAEVTGMSCSNVGVGVLRRRERDRRLPHAGGVSLAACRT